MVRRALAPALLIASLAAGAPARAQAPTGNDVDAACTGAYTSAQRLRKHSQLRAAKEQLSMCSRTECPSVLRGDCAQWLGEVQALLPTVVLAARTASGEDLMNVRVLLDGSLLADRLTGVAIEIDPGPHVLHYETDGASPVEQHVVVREGEKARRIDVVFQRSPPAGGPRAPAGPDPARRYSASSAPSESSASTPSLAYVLGGLGIVALGVGVYFEVTGLGKRTNLDVCKPNCNPDYVDAAKTDVLVGDIATGVGVVALVGAAYLFLSRPTASATPSTAWHLDVLPRDHGALAGLRRAF